jgi:hypothetical protein
MFLGATGESSLRGLIIKIKKHMVVDEFGVFGSSGSRGSLIASALRLYTIIYRI